MPQLVVIVQVLVAERDTHHPLDDQGFDAMFGEGWVAVIA